MKTRRHFLHSVLASGTAPLIVPRRLIAGSGEVPPSEKLRTLHVGTGGQGGGVLKEIGGFSEVEVVGLCDIDAGRLAGSAKPFPKAKVGEDWRRMLEDDKAFDAVVVATPDHHHAPVSLAAMQLKKHVYCEKPLAHTIEEARKMRDWAARQGVVTQMGNNGHANEGLRMYKEYVDAGAIGQVKEALVWTDRQGRWWDSQGQARPPETPTVPQGLNWDLWLGPAPQRAYHPLYAPFKWRGWWDFGCGALGDMAVHNADPVFYALDLGAPDWVEATTSPSNNDSFPAWNIITYQFPAKGARPALKMTWFDGGKMPENIPFLEKERRIGDNGCILIGDKGGLMGGSHSSPPRLFPETLMKSTPRPPKTIPRSEGHRIEWVKACLANKPEDAKAGFAYSAPFTEALLVGLLAVRFQKRIEWDHASMSAKNCPEAAPLIKKAYRQGFGLPV